MLRYSMKSVDYFSLYSSNSGVLQGNPSWIPTAYCLKIYKYRSKYTECIESSLVEWQSFNDAYPHGYIYIILVERRTPPAIRSRLTSGGGEWVRLM